MEYDYKNKNIDKLRFDLLYPENDNVVLTREMLDDIIFKINAETALNNKEEFMRSLLKLQSLKSAYDKLPYKIDKVKVLKFLKEELVDEKAFQMAILKQGIKNPDPIGTVMQLEIYELLLEYLENDETIKQNKSKHIKHKIKK